jgi:hypothetical protein
MKHTTPLKTVALCFLITWSKLNYLHFRSTYQVYVGESNEKQDNYIEDKANVPVFNEVSSTNLKTKFDLNPSGYPDKYKKFVKELSIILENINLGNEMINGSDHNKPIDDGLSCILNNLKDLGKNLMLAIENQIKDDKLMNLCLAINDDIALTILRYDDLKKKKKPRLFKSALKDEEDFQPNESSVVSNKTNQANNNNLIDIFNDLNIGSNVNNTVNNNINNNVSNNSNMFAGNSNDIFDFIGGGQSSNLNPSQGNANRVQINNNNPPVNNNQDLFSFDNIPVSTSTNVNNNNLPNTNNQKPVDNKKNLNDLISSLYENNYGNNNNSKDQFGNVI